MARPKNKPGKKITSRRCTAGSKKLQKLANQKIDIDGFYEVVALVTLCKEPVDVLVELNDWPTLEHILIDCECKYSLKKDKLYIEPPIPSVDYLEKQLSEFDEFFADEVSEEEPYIEPIHFTDKWTVPKNTIKAISVNDTDTLAVLAKRYGISISTVSRIRKQFGIRRKKAHGFSTTKD